MQLWDSNALLSHVLPRQEPSWHVFCVAVVRACQGKRLDAHAEWGCHDGACVMVATAQCLCRQTGPGSAAAMFLNIVKMALRALWRTAMRSFLTILGMVIGVAAVIAMVSIGRGSSAAVQERIGTMGNNLLIVLSGSTTQAGVRSGSGGR